jgi:hypothetical protein
MQRLFCRPAAFTWDDVLGASDQRTAERAKSAHTVQLWRKLSMTFARQLELRTGYTMRVPARQGRACAHHWGAQAVIGAVTVLFAH